MVSLNIKQIEASTVVVYFAGYLTIVFLSVCLGTFFQRTYVFLSISPSPCRGSACTYPTPFKLQHRTRWFWDEHKHGLTHDSCPSYEATCVM